MRIEYDFLNNKLDITNTSDPDLDSQLLTAKLNSYFDKHPIVKLDISGLDEDEITCLHTALTSVDNRSRLTTIIYQLEKDAEARLKDEFAHWSNIKFYQKSPVTVEGMQVFKHGSSDWMRQFQLKHPGEGILSVNPNIILNPNTTTKEGASTGMEFHKKVDLRR